MKTLYSPHKLARFYHTSSSKLEKGHFNCVCRFVRENLFPSNIPEFKTLDQVHEYNPPPRNWSDHRQRARIISAIFPVFVIVRICSCSLGAAGFYARVYTCSIALCLTEVSGRGDQARDRRVFLIRSDRVGRLSNFA